MVEFLFVEEAAEDKKGVELLEYLQDRLPRLLGHAKKLVQAGWHMDLTIGGFLFEPPDTVMAEIEKASDQKADLDEYLEAALEEHLRNLGIEDQFHLSPARPLAEVEEAAAKLFDRVWYEHTLVMLNSPGYDRAKEAREHPDIEEGRLRNMQRIEQEGLEEGFPCEDDFEWGMISGKLSALRWALGDEWDDLDT